MTAQSLSETHAIHSNSVSLCVNSWHSLAYGWMGHACRDMISITHDLLKYDKTHGIIDKSGVGAVGQTNSKNSDFANQNLFHGGCSILGGV